MELSLIAMVQNVNMSSSYVQKMTNCTVHCYDSRPYACFQTGVVCPSGRGDCTVNCNDSSACVQANVICPRGDCTVNCENDYTCSNSVMECSGKNCLINCEQRYSCQHSNIRCTSGDCDINCKDQHSCQYSTVLCPSDGLCTINCFSYFRACYQATFTCPENGNCLFNFNGGYIRNFVGARSAITCQKNSTCDIRCAGSSNNAQSSCYYARIVCPTDSSTSGDCAINVQCSGHTSCFFSTIVGGPGRHSLNCTGEHSCSEGYHHTSK